MRIDRIFSKMYDAKSFSTLDVRCGYYNITLSENSRDYTAFTTEYGKYKFLSPICHSRRTQLFCPKRTWILIAYLDDTIIFKKSEKEHISHL